MNKEIIDKLFVSMKETNKQNDLLKLKVKDVQNKYYLTNNTKLTSLDCSFLDITELDVSLFPLLNDLSCTSIPINKLDLSNNPDLESLECNRCNLTELDITNNQKLTYLSCGNQKGTSESNPMTLYLTETQEQNLWQGKGNMQYETENKYIKLEITN